MLFRSIKQIASDIQDARINIEDLKGENNVSDIMFELGKIYIDMSKCETELDEIVYRVEGECDECGDDF